MRRRKERGGGGGGEGERWIRVAELASEFFSRFARERAVSSARVGGPANNAGLVFLNPRRGISETRAAPSSPGPSRSERNRRVTSALAASGSRVPFSFYFLFNRRATHPGENGLTVPYGSREIRGRGPEGEIGDPSNELSRLSERDGRPERAARNTARIERGREGEEHWILWPLCCRWLGNRRRFGTDSRVGSSTGLVPPSRELKNSSVGGMYICGGD